MFSKILLMVKLTSFIHCRNSQVPIIGIVMGDRGLISRILCAKFGGYLTFGTLEAGVVSAPGQPTIEDLLNLYNIRQLGPDTKLYGIIGKPVGHSKSPMLYNEAFKSAGFNGVYLHLLVDDLAKFLQTYSSTDFAGFRFIPLLDIFILTLKLHYIHIIALVLILTSSNL